VFDIFRSSSSVADAPILHMDVNRADVEVNVCFVLTAAQMDRFHSNSLSLSFYNAANGAANGWTFDIWSSISLHEQLEQLCPIFRFRNSAVKQNTRTLGTEDTLSGSMLVC